MANVGALLRPSSTAPARTTLSTAGLLNLAMRCSYTLLPSVVANPAWSMFILTVTGTPARGPGSFPRANRSSTRSACSRTRSGRQSTIAVICGLTESSRCCAASATSRADTLRALTRRATSLADSCQSSLIEVPPQATLGACTRRPPPPIAEDSPLYTHASEWRLQPRPPRWCPALPRSQRAALLSKTALAYPPQRHSWKLLAVKVPHYMAADIVRKGPG